LALAGTTKTSAYNNLARFSTRPAATECEEGAFVGTDASARTHSMEVPPPPLLVGLCKMLGNCDGPVSVYEVPLAPVRQVLPLPLLAVLFAQLGHYHDPRSAGSVRKATGIIAATAARRLLSHRCDPA
ncbi:hypothetical protein PF006_g30669, partial [Phytophthora fragariae]